MCIPHTCEENTYSIWRAGRDTGKEHTTSPEAGVCVCLSA
jgi:hypothetical protein